MLIDALRIVVGLLGVGICVLAAWGMVDPSRVVALARRFAHDGSGFWFAVGGRIVFGIVLVYIAPAARFPTLFTILGWLSIAAGIGLFAIGRERLGRIIGWFERLPPNATRAWLTFAIAFGAFLVAGVV